MDRGSGGARRRAAGKTEGSRTGATGALRYAVAWLPMPVIAIANGALRELTFGKWMAGLHAHQLSTAIGAVAIGLYIRTVVRIWPPSSARNAFAVGLLWLILTVAFEFGFGRAVMHRSWAALAADYDLSAGRIWLLFLCWITLSPFLFHRFRASGARR
jgi:hypothetical protein